jgi:predicted P-loop ATPase
MLSCLCKKAYNPSTKEPLAVGVDRWWALRKIAVVVQPARFVDGHYCFGCNKAVELGAGALHCPCKVEKHVVYCSKECQKKDWKRHKGVCTAKKDA